MVALRFSTERPAPFLKPKKWGPDQGPRDLTGDHGEGGVAQAAPFDPVGMDEHGMGDPAPFPHEPRAGFNEIGGAGFARRLIGRVKVQPLQLPEDRFGEAADTALSWSL